ncbi:WD40 repeat-like protein [Metschnikowia bicuspidata var. bicuspidata NRRL YB-4993]|uniref:DNA damage-binding protein CMR1 n=1 Tax=Metschnikowia bicuspidata var. bicuspidata NRRL YB-4993 TaxID=869754 RepID=A0A1A0HBC9_9ASCO|nr:WD40 repeat-like protein [Metschnikowia bicuspidata var. bicuspidata NRRL YB-4993]OBA21193.1 WD40 repeat-like protein [Metschnikowia bicuspidata var. bicuspidata NRRL YB-4993]
MNDLETIRKKNIERNKELLKKLKLDSIHSSILASAKPKTKPSSQLKVKVDKALPTRRSKRLLKDPHDAAIKTLEEERVQKELSTQEKMRELRLSKLNGNFQIKDLLADSKLGKLFKEYLVYGEGGTANVGSGSETEEHEPDMRSSRELAVLHQLSQNITEFDDAMEKHTNDQDLSFTDVHENFANLKLHSLTDPSQVKLTPHRITSILFHPSTSDRMAFAGDTNGCLGIWAVDQKTEADQPNVVVAKPHGRAISKILDIPQKQTHIATASYDGSGRIHDLTKQSVIENFDVTDEQGNPIGISDINCSSQHVLYATTMNGQFVRHDMRENSKSVMYHSLVRLHDKKIGGFSINPADEFQIATASLDRTMKIWDLRNVSKRNSHSDILDGLAAPYNSEGYTSRLSISNVDWNSNQHLVCNGYDDRIRVFGISNQIKNKPATHTQRRKKAASVKGTFALEKEIKHNCQTGRWVSILKSRWQKSPTDGLQKFAIGNMNRSIDIYGEDGDLIANLSDMEAMTAIPAVVAIHPTNNWVIGGNSSGKVFIFN